MVKLSGKKSDNHNQDAKLDLRRYFLDRYHVDQQPHVMDCCQGGGVLWKQLRKEYEVGSYWGMDQKPKKGRLKIDSSRILAQPGWPQNAIDIDVYGSPWRHWFAMLPNVARPVTVFLTIGQGGTQFAMLSREEFDALGLNIPRLRDMRGIVFGLRKFAAECCLGKAERFGVRIIEAVEAESHGNARYLGVRLEPVGWVQPGVGEDEGRSDGEDDL